MKGVCGRTSPPPSSKLPHELLPPSAVGPSKSDNLYPLLSLSLSHPPPIKSPDGFPSLSTEKGGMGGWPLEKFWMEAVAEAGSLIYFFSKRKGRKQHHGFIRLAGLVLYKQFFSQCYRRAPKFLFETHPTSGVPTAVSWERGGSRTLSLPPATQTNWC